MRLCAVLTAAGLLAGTGAAPASPVDRSTDQVRAERARPAGYSQPFSRAIRTASARLRAASFWIAVER